MTDSEKRGAETLPAIVCVGSGEYVPAGWSWYPCPGCGAAVWRDPATLGLVEHTPGSRGTEPIEETPEGQD